MALVPIFHAHVTDAGKVQWVQREQAQRARYLESLVGEAVEVVIRKRRSQRSEQANRYLHGVVFPLLSTHCGYTLTEIKLVLMGECFGWHTVGGRELPRKPHTSEMTVEECSYFISWVVPWAVEQFDLQIPLPGEAEESAS